MIEKDHGAIDNLFNNNNNFEKVYEDEEVKIYR